MFDDETLRKYIGDANAWGNAFASDHDKQSFVCAMKDGKPIGMLGVPFDPGQGTLINIEPVLLTPEAREKSVMQAMRDELLTSIAFHMSASKRLKVLVDADQRADIAAFESVGFQVTPVQDADTEGKKIALVLSSLH